MFHMKPDEQPFDIGMSFSFASADRLSIIDASLPLLDTYNAVLLSGKLCPAPTGYSDLILRPSVFFVISILTIIVMGAAYIYFVAETWHADRSLINAQTTLNGKLGLSVEFSSTSVLGQRVNFSNPLSRATKTLVGFVNLIIMNILGAVVTSKLTASSINSATPSLSSLKGARIGIQLEGTTLQSYIQSPQISAAAVLKDSLTGLAKDFFCSNPDRLDGFATNPEILKYLWSVYGTGDQKFCITDPFAVSGSPEPRGFLLNKNLDPDIVRRFNIGMQYLRDQGRVANLFRTYLTVNAAPVMDDIPVEPTLYLAVTATALTLVALYVGATVLLRAFPALDSAAVRMLFPPRAGADAGAAASTATLGTVDVQDDDDAFMVGTAKPPPPALRAEEVLDIFDRLRRGLQRELQGRAVSAVEAAPATV
jgi:hypothetical protein